MSWISVPRTPRIFASRVDRDLHVPVLVALLLGGEEVLAPVLDPFDRPAQRQRRRGERAVFGIEAALRAEAAADVGRDDAQLVVAQSNMSSSTRLCRCDPCEET